MKKFAVLVGNDINNIDLGYSWSDLLEMLTKTLSITVDFTNKPFPMAYEEMYFKAAKQPNFVEDNIKKLVAEHVNKIKSSSIHKKIMELETDNILTTNYDFSLESSFIKDISQLKNNGSILESKYSIFRHYTSGQKKFWHIHGSADVHKSITLGYEHYSGYLQNMRNYVVSGTKDTYKSKTFKSLIKRLKDGDTNIYSWIDLFFTIDIHIFGLSLDFSETDLWWILTYLGKCKYVNKLQLKNKIYYYIPDVFFYSDKSKIAVLESIGVIIVPLSRYETSKSSYYHKVIGEISKMYS